MFHKLLLDLKFIIKHCFYFFILIAPTLKLIQLLDNNYYT